MSYAWWYRLIVERPRPAYIALLLQWCVYSVIVLNEIKTSCLHLYKDCVSVSHYWEIRVDNNTGLWQLVKILLENYIKMWTFPADDTLTGVGSEGVCFLQGTWLSWKHINAKKKKDLTFTHFLRALVIRKEILNLQLCFFMLSHKCACVNIHYANKSRCFCNFAVFYNIPSWYSCMANSRLQLSHTPGPLPYFTANKPRPHFGIRRPFGICRHFGIGTSPRNWGNAPFLCCFVAV